MKNFLHVILTVATALFTLQWANNEVSVWAPISAGAAYAVFLVVILWNPEKFNFRIGFTVGFAEVWGVVVLTIINWKAGLLYLSILLSAALVMSVIAVFSRDVWENYNREAFRSLTEG